MSTWKGAWLLLRYEWRQNWLGSLATLLLATYIVAFTFPLYKVNDFSQEAFLAGTIDFIMLCIVPCLGFFMNQTTFRNVKEDYTARKLAAMRAMPITVKQIAAGRVMSMLSLLLPMWIYFFTMIFLLSGWFFQQSWVQLLSYALFWLGYAVFMSVVYLIMELGFASRKYLLSCIGTLPLFAAVVLLCRLSGHSLVGDLLGAAAVHNWWPALGALLAGAVSILAGVPLLASIISRRSLLG